MKVLISGAASGIGAGLSQRLINRGDTVIAADLYPPPDGPRRIAATLDVRDPHAWSSLLDSHPDVDVVCNVAGVLRPGWINDITPADVDLQLDVNVKGLIFGTQAAARVMSARSRNRRGRIINIASMAAVFPTPGNSVYSTSKFAARGFSLAAAAELAEHGIAVSVVCPAGVQTPMLDLQKNRTESALTFASARALTVDEVVDAIVEVIDARRPPVERLVPRASGVLAKYLSASPATYLPLVRSLTRAGRKRQADQTPAAGNNPTLAQNLETRS